MAPTQEHIISEKEKISDPDFDTRPHTPTTSSSSSSSSSQHSHLPQQQHQKSDIEAQTTSLHHVQSHISTHDVTHSDNTTHYEQGDEIYSKFSPRRKAIIVCVLCICAFLAPISSTAIVAASPEVVATYNTTGTLFDLSNALYLLFMGISPLFWGPLGSSFGRKPVLVSCGIAFTAFSAASALAPNLASYFVFRMLTAFQGTSFLIVGGTVIGDIYRPIERGTAYGWFLTGTLVGPALGPLIAGIIVTYRSWRDIFWLQTALSGVATIATIFLLPETIHRKRSAELIDLSKPAQIRKLWTWINPLRVLILFRYPNLLIAGISSASLVWNMYSLLTPIRYVLNPRFDLTSPLQSGLFYIAPGCGYLLGTFFGGRWADRVVKKYIRKRGVRVPEDRLHSCLTAMGVVIPACMLIYGWSIEKRVGGIALPVVVMFLQGVAQLFCFPSLNTYCLDVMQKRSSEVVAGNYVVRYLFGMAGSAACLPVIEKIGVGWFSTISAAFVFVAAVGTWTVSVWGKEMRDWADRRFDADEE